MKIHVGIKYLLNNTNENFYKTESSIYSKLQITDDLVMLFRTQTCGTRNNLAINYSVRDFAPVKVGIYSLKSQKFLLLFDDNYGINEVLLGQGNFYEDLNYNNIRNKFNDLIKTEIQSIFNLSKANKTNDYWEELRNSVMFNSTYQYKYSLTGYEQCINIENVENVLHNTEDYAFEVAEDFVNNNQELVAKYIKSKDIETVSEELTLNKPIQMKLREKINDIKSNYGTVTLVLLDRDDNEVTIKSFPTKNLNTYPAYRIKKVLSRKQEIFNRNFFDETELKSLETEKYYNFYCIKSLHYSYSEENSEKDECKENYFKFLTNDLLYDKDFVKMILDYRYALCKYIPEGAISDTDIIDKWLNKYCGSDRVSSIFNIIEYVNLDTFNYYKKEILSSVDTNNFNICKLKKFVDYDLLVSLVNNVSSFGLTALNEDLAKLDEVQDFIVNTFTNFQNEFYEQIKINLALIKDKNVIINLATYNSLEYISDDLKTDEDFAIKIVKKAFDDRRSRNYYFDYFYRIFKPLKDNENFMLNLSKCFSIYDCKLVEEFTEEIKDVCLYELCKHNKQIAYYTSDNLKEQLLKEDISYLRYFFDISQPWETKWVLKAVQLSLNCNNCYCVFDDIHKHVNKQVLIDILKINPELMLRIDGEVAQDYEIAYELSKDISIIPYLNNYHLFDEKNRLYNNKEIMMRCIKHNPGDAKKIPNSTSIYKATILEDKEFIKEAFTLDYYNAKCIDTPLKRDSSLLKELMIEKHFETYVGFQVSLLRDESLVTEILDTIISKYGQDADWSDIVSRVKNTFMKDVPKKIKETNSFKAKYSQFC